MPSGNTWYEIYQERGDQPQYITSFPKRETAEEVAQLLTNAYNNGRLHELRKQKHQAEKECRQMDEVLHRLDGMLERIPGE